jgi:23S rRNA (pseudouridine1915-N3)-methyltransferase
MVKINIVAVGKVKEKYFLDGINEYSKRMGKFADFTITEVSEENYTKVDDSLIQTIKEKEADRILPHLKGYVYCMAIEGKKMTSEQFAGQLKGLIDQGKGVITLVIGGSYGLSDRVKAKADKLFSFSDMTFPHTLFRLMLCEQVYRAFSIMNGSSYHK